MMWTIMITPMGAPQTGAISLMLALGLVLDMTSMEERFQNRGRITIQNLANRSHMLKKKMI